MEFLFSNLAPLRTQCNTFADTFYNLIPSANRLDIAVGYISTDSIAELEKTVEMNTNLSTVNLIIGMHYLEKFTKSEYHAVQHLSDFLSREGKGDVRLVTSFKYHGKLYTYSNNNGTFAGIIGSNNLSSIVGSFGRIYESSVLIDDRAMATMMKDFIDKLSKKCTESLSELKIEDFKSENSLLEGHELVKKASLDSRLRVSDTTGYEFEIPITTAETAGKSNINAFFGKGRETKKTGLIKPRHWYEVELIVPKEITDQEGYPNRDLGNDVFEVITDDGWSFKCNVSGTNNKNFRSDGDLKILGKWLKGRLENADCLKVGDPVTKDTLKKYGRDSFTLKSTSRPNVWYINFEADNKKCVDI